MIHRAPLLTVALFLLAAAEPAAAASAVTFVSGTGRDTGACTRAAPCRLFRYAITQTTPGGVIAALDRAGFGVVSITQSITIVGPGKGAAGMSPNGTSNSMSGIDIEAPGGTVVLRGLEIDGGTNGILIGQAARVVISDTVITGSSNLAIYVGDTGASVLVQDTTVQNAEIDTGAANFVAKRLTVSDSPGSGIVANVGRVMLDDCTISGSVHDGIGVYGGTTIIKHGVIASVGGSGILIGTGLAGYLDRTTTFGNHVGLSSAGTAYSYGNNNFPDGTSGTIASIAGD